MSLPMSAPLASGAGGPAAGQATAAAAGAGPAGARPDSTAVYVGDIPTDLGKPEETLQSLFSTVGPLVSVKLCRDSATQRSRGYAFVNFQNPQDAERAVQTLNFAEIVPGRQIRVMQSQRDAAPRKLGLGNLFVKNIDPSVDTRRLAEAFGAVGKVASCKLATDGSGRSRGYGFVAFDEEATATEAMTRLNGTMLGATEITVCPFKRQQERKAEEEQTFVTVFMKNLKKDVTEEEIRALLEPIGAPTAVYLSSSEQHGTGHAVVTMESHEDAVKVIETLNGTQPTSVVELTSDPLYVARAMRRGERKLAMDRATASDLHRDQGRTIYVKHLDEETSEEQVRELFSRYGDVKSAAVVKDVTGVPRGFGFVSFSDKESAERAVSGMNGNSEHSRRALFVGPAMRRDRRSEFLGEQFKEATREPRGGMRPPGAGGRGMDTAPGVPSGPHASQRPVGMRGGVAVGAGGSGGPVVGSYPGAPLSGPPSRGGHVNMASGGPPGYGFGGRGMAPQAVPGMSSTMPYSAAPGGPMPGGMFGGPGGGFVPQGGMGPFGMPAGGMVATMGGAPWMRGGSTVPAHMMSHAMHAGAHQAGLLAHHAGHQVPVNHPGMMGHAMPGAPLRPAGAVPAPYGGAPHRLGEAPVYHPEAAAAPPPPVPAMQRNPAQAPLNAQTLAGMPVAEQKNALGERLYPRVQALSAQQAPKLTGMLLEMETSEILLMLEDQAMLTSKVQEAVSVLRQHVDPH